MALVEKIGGIIDINTTNQTGIQFEPCIAALDNGGFVVGWNNFQVGISARLFDAAGFGNGAEFGVNTTSDNDQGSPDVATLSDGSFQFAWMHEYSTTDLDIRGRRFLESGSAVNATDVSIATTSARDESGPSITSTLDGRYLVAWNQDDGRLGFRQNNISGSTLSSGPVTDGGNGTESNPIVATLRNGEIVVVYQAGGNIFERRMVAGDNAALVNSNSGVTHTLPSVAALENGGYVIAWEEGNAGSKFINLQRYDFLGNKVGSAFTAINVAGQIDQTTPIVKGLVGGGFVVAWDDGVSGLRAAAFTDAGAQIGSTIQLTASGASGSFGDMDIVQKKDGDVVFVWAGSDADGVGIDGQILRIFNEVVGTNGDDRLATQLSGGVSNLRAGFQANDSIQGLGGNDTLQGFGGAQDILDGGSGIDTASYIDAPSSVAANLGIPAFNNGQAIGDSYISIENLEGSFFGDQLTGNGSANQLDGVDGNDFLEGLGGNDVLLGNIGQDDLEGGSGSDRLDGGSGADTMTGGADSDTYRVDNAADTIVEGTGGGTLDWVAASVSFVLGAGVQVEKFSTTSSGGTSAINLTGNTLAQAITGNAGANVLSDGGAGKADTMSGLGGNDTYRVFNSADIIAEGSTQGTADRVIAAVDYKLGAGVHVELMTTNGSTGTSGIDLSGNEFVQSITGNAGNNRLEGREGSDTLRGLGGDDTFVFNTKLGASNVDTVVDFNVADDRFLLSDAIFTTVNTGILASGYFRSNTTGLAQDSNDHIIYERDTGELYYDSNGNASGGSVLFAKVAVGLSLTNADFSVA